MEENENKDEYQEEEEERREQPDKPYSKPEGYGYGKRPTWQWVLIYLVAAAIVYTLIYFLLRRSY